MLSPGRVGCSVVAILLLAAPPAIGQRVGSRAAEPEVPEKAGKELVAHYVGDTPPRIDGDLDDEVWQRAQLIDDMVQNDPDNMQPPTERTVVKVLYDGTLVLELSVADRDYGKVIGRGGRTAPAIRAVIKAAAVKDNRRVLVDIVD